MRASNPSSCSNFFKDIRNAFDPKISLEGKELDAYYFLAALVEKKENPSAKSAQSVFAPFNDPRISDETFLIKKKFISSVKDALYFYLLDHGAAFNLSEGKRFAQANASVDTCEHALKIIETILKESDPKKVSESSRLYRLVSQFASNVDADSSVKVCDLLSDILLNPPTASQSEPAKANIEANNPKLS
ncbi:MAG: hypothetical protein A3F13_04450 [Gammaproteobacteria bacterium RIFCSPHIGHO2_12_FULL_40_19]|nr:MAG: hypothetical protein A3F13_04450 [Gammaproteobacteria bacterium RIFCSPHIGHO2_12_FULL_40_19]